jgi:hypothetical protein
MFDTETDFKNAPEGTLSEHGLPSGGFAPSGGQVAWLQRDLEAANADRSERPWIIVGGHRPIYNPRNCSASGEPIGQEADLQAAIEDLMVKYEVDLYFCGHVHAYYRTKPVYKGKVDAAAPAHFIVGGAGCDEV